MSDVLKSKIQIYLSNRHNRYLFESNRGTRFSTRRIQQLTSHYKFRANIDGPQLTPHTFRHLYNTRLAEAGVSKETRALLAGHSNSNTQDIYTHLSVGGQIATDILKKLSELGL
jgi:site-specific recombinase XerD